MDGRFIHHLAEKNIISEDEKEIYSFGLSQLKFFLAGIITDISIGILFGMLWQCLLFTATYIPLRQYAGGYHARTPKICYLMSVILVCTALVIIKYASLGTGMLALTVLISLVVIFCKAPVESINKPLNDKERAVFKKYARIISSFEGLVSCMLYCIGFETASKCVLAAMGLSAALLLFSDKKNKTTNTKM